MGTPDNIYLPCPKCNKEDLYAQHKPGWCDSHKWPDIPEEILLVLDGDEFKCEHCKTKFKLNYKTQIIDKSLEIIE